jgi:hypothetical protein
VAGGGEDPVDTWVWIVIAIVAVIVIVAVAVSIVGKRRTTSLRDQFGPEYERTVGLAEDRRAAEGELAARRERRQGLDIRPLSPSARDGYVERWRRVQAGFVDEPGAALMQADRLVLIVMRERGYPMDDFEQRAADISVDHPDVVDHYRAAHATSDRAEADRADTEEIRKGFVHYRALFEDLLEVDDDRAREAREA